MKKSLIGLSLILLVMFCGCAGPSSKNMLPSFNYDQVATTNKTIKVAQIRGGQIAQFGGMEKLNSETFEVAIIDSLKNSRLYKDVSNDKQAYYDLIAEILFQESVVGPGLAYTTFMIVEYQLIETESQKEMLHKNIYSRSTSTAFAGGTRMVEALEGATQKNISKLIIALSKLEDQDQKLVIHESDIAEQSGDQTKEPAQHASEHISFKVFYDHPFSHDEYKKNMTSVTNFISYWKDPTVNLKKYESVSLNEFGGKILNDEDNKYETYLSLFNEKLKKYLGVGYQTTEKSSEDLSIFGEMVECDPGNRALRYVIGFGAGKAAVTILSEVYEPDQTNPALCVYIRVPAFGGIFGGDSDEMLKYMVQLSAGLLSTIISEQTGL